MVWSAIAYCLSSSRNFGGADGSVVCCWGCPWAETRRDEGNRRVEDFVGRLNCEGVVRWTSEEADTEADTVVIEIDIELIVLAIDGIVYLVSVRSGEILVDVRPDRTGLVGPPDPPAPDLGDQALSFSV